MASMYTKKPVISINEVFEKFLDTHRLILSVDIGTVNVRTRIRDTTGTYACDPVFTRLARTDYQYTGIGVSERGSIIALLKKVSGKTLYFLPMNGRLPYKLEMPILEIEDA